MTKNTFESEWMLKALALEAAPYNIALNTMGPGKRVKPTDVTWAQLDAMPAEQKAGWADPVELGKAFVWLAVQPPYRYSGLRFDAGPIVDTIAREGWDFEFAPESHDVSAGFCGAPGVDGGLCRLNPATPF